MSCVSPSFLPIFYTHGRSLLSGRVWWKASTCVKWSNHDWHQGPGVWHCCEVSCVICKRKGWMVGWREEGRDGRNHAWWFCWNHVWTSYTGYIKIVSFYRRVLNDIGNIAHININLCTSLWSMYTYEHLINTLYAVLYTLIKQTVVSLSLSESEWEM